MICCIFTLLSWVGFAWFAAKPSPPPSIHFVEFRESKYGRVAIFRVRNDSNSSFSYYGYSPTTPFYKYRFQTTQGWREIESSWCGTGADLHEILPHSSIEIQTFCEARTSPFAIGIHFERGTPKHIASRSGSPVSDSIKWIRGRLNLPPLPPSPEPEPIWSSTALPD